MSHLSLTYELKDEALQHWGLVNQALSRLAASNRVWLVESANQTYDWKRNAGSSNLVDRKQARVALRQIDFMQCSLTPFCIQAGKQRLFFLPDRVYICVSDKYTTESLADVEVKLDSISFIEEEQSPADAEVIGSTWKYVNKDGGPDLRFMDNCPLPIVEYAVVILLFKSGHETCLYVSSASAAQAFADIIHRVRQSSLSVICRQYISEDKAHQNKAAVNQQSADCYAVLGITRQSTLEEASAAYRQLAKQYHPDVVCRLAPEFRQLAEERMKQINQAHAELKKIKSASCEMMVHQPQVSPDKAASSSASVGSKGRLVVLEGTLAGTIFDVGTAYFIIGRDDGCHLRLIHDPIASRRHAHINKQDNRYIVHDDGSKNGTFVNGVRVQMQALASGDIVQFGNSKFRFE